MTWTGAHCAFAVGVFFNTSKSVIFVLILCYVRRMLFWIENWYCYGLKISEPQIYWLKESHLEDPQVHQLKKKVNLVFFLTFKVIVTDFIWEKKKKSYHCHLPKFTFTTEVTVLNVGGISAVPCMSILSPNTWKCYYGDAPIKI